MRKPLRNVPGLDKADRVLGKLYWRTIGIVCWGVALIMVVLGLRILLGPPTRWDGLILVAGGCSLRADRPLLLPQGSAPDRHRRFLTRAKSSGS
jgi:hypothetical protein